MAEAIGTAVATEVAKPLVTRAMEEAGYLCCYNRYVEDYEDKKRGLLAASGSLQDDVKEAKQRNESLIDKEAKNWLNEANHLIIEEDTKTKKKWFFGLCTNCILQYRQGKKFAKKASKIPTLIERKNNLVRVARPAGPPGMKYHCSSDFMHFESRKAKFEQLKEALKNDNNHLVGLQGMGGTGKTTMATQVGNEVEESKLFDKVIFIVVSNPPNVEKIRSDIARHLVSKSDDAKELEKDAASLRYRITNDGEKILIILDDVWEKELDLKVIGIPVGLHDKGRCSVFLTTRDLKVCKAMGCQEMIQVHVLHDKEALNLFLYHAVQHGVDSSSDFKDVALDIVKWCGGLPVAIEAIAKSLNSEPLQVWKDTSTALQNFDPMLYDDVVDGAMKKAYKCLKLSYDNLKDEKAQKLFLLCSLFPEDFEIPVELLSRIAIGLGLFGEVDEYKKARRQVREVKRKLVDSSLLLEDEKEENVKMHDLVHDVAIKIADKVIQVVRNSKTALKENVRFSSWIDGFPDRFDGSKLKILMIFITSFVEFPDSLFESMTKLRVLVIDNDGRKIRGSFWEKSVQSLINIRTLRLAKLMLEDISGIGNLQSLETLELFHCSIVELPNEITKLEKLRLLGLTDCDIERNNPFKVIERCSRLEELYYRYNEDIFLEKLEDEVRDIGIPPTLQMYDIIGGGGYFGGNDASLLRRFKPRSLQNIFSEAAFKFLVAKAEILELDGIGWKNPIEDGGRNDLIKLSLESFPKMECLIHTKNIGHEVTIFAKLVKIKLSTIGVKELCCGPFPSGFLKKLEKLHLYECSNLKETLFKSKLDLGKLKCVKLNKCSMSSLFHPSTAQSLKQLEELKIWDCCELKCIITDEGLGEDKVEDDPNEMSHGSMFSKLKSVQIFDCDKLEFILPIRFVEDLPLLEIVKICQCGELKHIFGQHQDEGVSYQKGKEIKLPSLEEMKIDDVPNFINIFPAEYCHNPMSHVMKKLSTTKDDLKVKDPSLSCTFSWALTCCFMSKSTFTNIDSPIVSETALPNCTGLQDTTKCLLRHPLNPLHLRKLEIRNCSNLTSLFTLSIASSMSLLEYLEVTECHGLKHIVTNEGDNGHDHMSYGSIFPNLKRIEIWNCSFLEDIFPASHCRSFNHLKSVTIVDAKKLRYVFGKCYCEDNLPHHNQNMVEIRLPVLNCLRLEDVPNMVSIGTRNYHFAALSLKTVSCAPSLAGVFQGIDIQYLLVRDGDDKHSEESHEEIVEYIENGASETNSQLQEGLKAQAALSPSQDTSKRLLRQPLLHLREMRIYYCSNLTSLFTLSVASSMSLLEYLEVTECHGLKHIVTNEGDNGHDHMNYGSIFPNLKRIVIRNCSFLEDIFPASHCRSFNQLEFVEISSSHKLRYVFGKCYCEDNLPHHTENVEIHLPVLKKISIKDCSFLEYIFPASHCRSFNQLEFVEISSSHKLRYVFGKCYCEDNLPPHNQNVEIHLPALKDLLFDDVPNLVSIGTQNCDFTTLSLEAVDSPLSLAGVFQGIDFQTNIPQTSSTKMDDEYSEEPHHEIVEYNENSASETNSQLQEGPKAQGALSKKKLSPSQDTAKCLLRRPLNSLHLREMRIVGCSNLTSLFTFPIASSMLFLEELKVKKCHGLKHLITHEGDGHDRKNKSSIFPKLENVSIKKCRLLESLFPASHCATFDHLESVKISRAHKLRYVFGKCYCEDKSASHNQNEIRLPTLNRLIIHDVPNMVNICSENIYMKASSLKEFDLIECPQLPVIPDHLTDFILGLHQIQDDLAKRKAMEMQLEDLDCRLTLWNVKIEMVFDLERLQVKEPMKSMLEALYLKNLAELRYICVGLKNILSLQNLSHLVISGCKKLKAIFSESISRSLPQLEKIFVTECEELVQIIEESEQDHDLSHQECFPNLTKIHVKKCKRLKCLFSISTCGVLPNLKKLKIEDASELKQVFGYNHDEEKEMAMKDVFPKLETLVLNILPSLDCVCQGFDFQIVSKRYVHDCPKISLTSTITISDVEDGEYDPWLAIKKEIIETSSEDEEGPEDQYNHVQSKSSEEATSQSKKESTKEVVDEDLEIQEQNNNTSNLTESTKAATYNFPTTSLTFPTTMDHDDDDSKLEQEMVGSNKNSAPNTNSQFQKEEMHPSQFSANQTQSILTESKKEATKEDFEKELGIQEQNNSTPNVTEIIEETMDSSVEECPKLEKTIIANEIMESEPSNASPQDTLVGKEAEVGTIIMGKHNIEVSVGEGTSSKRYNKPTSTTHCSVTTTKSKKDLGIQEGEMPPSQFSTKKAIEEVVEKDLGIQEQNNSTSNLTKAIEETMDSIVQEGPKLEKTIIANEIMELEPSNASHQRKKEVTKKVVDEDLEIQEQNNNTSNLTESNKVGPNEIIEQVPSSDIPTMAASSSNSDMNKERGESSLQEGLKSENEIRANEIMDSEELSKASPPATLLIPLQNESPQNINESVGDGSSSKKYNKPSSSTHCSKTTTKELNEIARGVDKPPDNIQDVEEPTKDQCSSEERSNITTAIPPTLVEMNDSDKIIVNQTEIDNPKQIEEDDLIRLFQIMEEGADMEVHKPIVSKFVVVEEDNNVAKAFADLEVSLKMGVNEIASSVENSLRLQNALNLLSNHFSEDGPPSHGLSATIDSLHQEFQSILSSFKQASSTVHAFAELEDKEKCMINEELPQRKQKARTLVSEIFMTDKSMVVAQQKEAELKEQISRLQAELNSKEKEINDCEMKLLSLQEQKKKSVSETMRFMKDFEDVKKDKSQMMEEEIKARQELEKVDAKWSSCVTNLRKTTLLLGIHLNHNL